LRIVIISDIHSNLEALEAVISSLDSYDEIFCLGDLVGYGAQPNEIISRIRFLKPRILITGNHDFAVVTGDTSNFASHAALAVEWTRQEISSENLSYLRDMQLFSSFTQDDICVKAYHGSPREPLDEYVFPGTADYILKSMVETAQCDILLLGHTHMPIEFRSNSLYLFNPGSVGQPRDSDPRASYGILEIEKQNINFKIKKVNYDIDSAAAKILKKPVPNFLADRLHLGY
jgi:putative phosphoesterase